MKAEVYTLSDGIYQQLKHNLKYEQMRNENFIKNAEDRYWALETEKLFSSISWEIVCNNGLIIH